MFCPIDHIVTATLHPNKLGFLLCNWLFLHIGMLCGGMLIEIIALHISFIIVCLSQHDAIKKALSKPKFKLAKLKAFLRQLNSHGKHHVN
jgi:hypothetical protein